MRARPFTRWALAFTLAALLFTLTPTPALAVSATRFDIRTSAAQTATGNGGAIPVAGITEMAVLIDCTTSSGTTPVLDLYLQSSSDGGTTWYDLPFELSIATTNPASAAAGVVQTDNRDILNGTTDCATNDVRAIAKYSVFGDQVRAAWVISGTTPSFTFSVKAIGK
jgi:hypothetical protein